MHGVIELCPEREGTETVSLADGGVIYLLHRSKHFTSDSTEHTNTEMEVWEVQPEMVDLTDP